MLAKSAKYFTLSKNGKPDTVSINRLKPAYMFEDNNKDKERGTRAKEITQPSISDREPESSRVPGDESEVVPLDYRAAVLRDLSSPPTNVGRQKRIYVKKKAEKRTETVVTRSCCFSRSLVRDHVRSPGPKLGRGGDVRPVYTVYTPHYISLED